MALSFEAGSRPMQHKLHALLQPLEFSTSNTQRGGRRAPAACRCCCRRRGICDSPVVAAPGPSCSTGLSWQLLPQSGLSQNSSLPAAAMRLLPQSWQLGAAKTRIFASGADDGRGKGARWRGDRVDGPQRSQGRDYTPERRRARRPKAHTVGSCSAPVTRRVVQRTRGMFPLTMD